MKYTLITGSSTGLGKEMAIACAQRKMNLILVALPGRNLHCLANDIQQKFSVSALPYELDLTNDVHLHTFVEEVTQRYSINFLINNAGTGGTGDFVETSLDSIDRIIQLNVRATVMLTRLLIPTLLKCLKSYVMNVSSMAAFSPIAYKTIYPASKAFIASFSIGLRKEFQHKGLYVSAVFPGPILTNSDVTLRILAQGKKASATLITTSKIANMAIDKTLKGKAMIIPGFFNLLGYRFMRVLPTLWITTISSNIVRAELRIARKFVWFHD
jgi:uncharacterized protein